MLLCKISRYKTCRNINHYFKCMKLMIKFFLIESHKRNLYKNDAIIAAAILQTVSIVAFNVTVLLTFTAIEKRTERKRYSISMAGSILTISWAFIRNCKGKATG